MNNFECFIGRKDTSGAAETLMVLQFVSFQFSNASKDH